MLRVFSKKTFLPYVLSTLVFSYPLYSNNILPTTLSLALMLGGCAVILALFSTQRFQFRGERVGLIMWLVLAGYVLLNTVALSTNFGTMRIWHPFSLVLLIVIMVSLSRTENWVMPAMRTLVAMLLPFAVFTVILYVDPMLFSPIKALLFPDAVAAKGYQSGLTPHYSYNGFYCTIGFLVTFGCFFSTEKGQKYRIVWLLFLAVFLLAVLLIGKRQNLLFGLLSVGACVLLSGAKGKGLRFVGMIVALVGGLMLCAAFVPGISESLERLISSFGEENLDDVTSGRTFVWQTAISGWSESPLFGNGWNTFSHQFSLTNTVHVAHNELLDQLYCGGLIGALLATACVLISLVTIIAAYRRVASGGGEAVCPISRVSLAVSLLIQLYMVMSGYSIGTILAEPPFFAPYLLALSIGYASMRGIGASAQKGEIHNS